MKKVVLFIDSLVAGGAQRQIVVLACALKEKGYKTIVVTYRFEHQLKGILDECGVQSVVIQKKYVVDFVFMTRLYFLFVRLKPDCIISYLNTPNLWARLIGRAAGVKKIVTSERNIDIGKNKIRLFLEKLLHKYSSKIIVNAYAIRDVLIGFGVPSSKVEVVYNGLDTEYFKPMCMAEVNEFRVLHGVSSDDYLITLPGRMVPQKNHISLIEAMGKIKNPAKPWKVFFAGNEICLDIKKNLVDKISEMGFQDRVVFLGPQKNMPLLYSASDLIVLPSLWEGLPNVVLEAMSCGKAVIASDVSDNALIIKHGQTGFIHPAGDSTALAHCVDLCMGKSLCELTCIGAMARNHIQDLCSLSKFTSSYENIIDY